MDEMMYERDYTIHACLGIKFLLGIGLHVFFFENYQNHKCLW